jgi:sarcosine oxidase
MAHGRLAEASGAELHFTEPVLDWEASTRGEGVTVRTGVTTYRAGRLVLCPGAWASTLLPDIPIGLKVERQVQTWFEPEGGVEPFLADRHPIWMWEPDIDSDVAGFHGFVYGLLAIDGPDGGVKMSIVTEPEPSDPDTIDRTVTAAEVEVVAAQLRRRLTVDPGRLLRADTCMFENTPDHHFVVAAHGRHPQVTVAAGFSGHGFKFVPVIGEILADLALEGRTSHPIALFDPERLNLK